MGCIPCCKSLIEKSRYRSDVTHVKLFQFGRVSVVEVWNGSEVEENRKDAVAMIAQ